MSQKKPGHFGDTTFLLPHELLQTLSDMGDKEELTDTAGLDVVNRARHVKILQDMGEPFTSRSLWGDGVPFSWDRKKSADLWTLSLPGSGHKTHKDLRFTLTSVPHESVTRQS